MIKPEMEFQPNGPMNRQEEKAIRPDTPTERVICMLRIGWDAQHIRMSLGIPPSRLKRILTSPTVRVFIELHRMVARMAVVVASCEDAGSTMRQLGKQLDYPNETMRKACVGILNTATGVNVMNPGKRMVLATGEEPATAFAANGPKDAKNGIEGETAAATAFATKGPKDAKNGIERQEAPVTSTALPAEGARSAEPAGRDGPRTRVASIRSAASVVKSVACRTADAACHGPDAERPTGVRRGTPRDTAGQSGTVSDRREAASVDGEVSCDVAPSGAAPGPPAGGGEGRRAGRAARRARPRGRATAVALARRAALGDAPEGGRTPVRRAGDPAFRSRPGAPPPPAEPPQSNDPPGV